MVPLNPACLVLAVPSLNVPWLQAPTWPLRTLINTDRAGLPTPAPRIVGVSRESTKGCGTGLWSVPGEPYKLASLRWADSWPRVSFQETNKILWKAVSSTRPHLSASLPDGSASNQRLILLHNLIQANASAKKMLYDRKQKVRPS